MCGSPGLFRFTLDGWRTYYEIRLRKRSRSVYDTFFHSGHFVSGTLLEFTIEWSGQANRDDGVFRIAIED